MDAKLNHSDLSTLLAQKGNLPVSKAEQFSKAFFDIIIEGLESDGIVKINGLGTFKMVDVASRSSVNVNTGEKIEIKGHRKLSFIPADSLKERINEPLSHLVPEELDDDYVDDTDVDSDELSEEIAVEPGETTNDETDTAEVVATMETEQNSGESNSEETVENEPVDVENETIGDVSSGEESKTTEEISSVTDDAVEQEEEKTDTVENETTEETVQEISAPAEASNEKGKKRIMPAILYITLFIIICAGLYLFYTTGKTGSEQVAEVIDKNAISTGEIVNDSVDTITEEITLREVEPDSMAMENDSVVVKPFVMIERLAQRPLGTISLADTLDYKACGDIALHVVTADETLTKIAVKYYGDKRLWPYIVSHNRMDRPNDLAKGMELKIPNLQPADAD